MRRLLLAALASLVACRATPTPTVVQIAPAQPAAPTYVSSGESVIVWVQRDDAVVSLWIDDGPKGPAVRAERGERVVATRGGLVAVRERARKLDAMPGCGCDDGVPEKECKVRPEASDAVAVPLGGGEPRVLASYDEALGCGDRLLSASSRVEISGVVGPIVFLGVDAEESCCEAPHPIFANDDFSFDLESGVKLQLTPPQRADAAIRRHARERFKVEGEGCVMNVDEEPTFYTAYFNYDGTGRLQGHYVFTSPSNYMCGTGPGHYSMALDVEDPALPPEVEPYREAPAWLRPWLHDHPILGVSPLPAELDVQRARAQFDAPMK